VRKRRPDEKASTTARGYGIEHKRLRDKWRKVVEAGEATCSRCGRWIAPGSSWHLDHSDDRSGYIGASHARCNVGAANKRRARKARKPPLHSSGLW
jgi:hypothetical protein